MARPKVQVHRTRTVEPRVSLEPHCAELDLACRGMLKPPVLAYY